MLRLLSLSRACSTGRACVRRLSGGSWRAVTAAKPRKRQTATLLWQPVTLERSSSSVMRQLRWYSTDLPPHKVIKLPALSPTMEQGTIVSWEKQEGDEVEEGDIIAQVETDKAVMDMETTENGFIAKILVPAGTADIPLKTPLAIIVKKKDNMAAFTDYQSPDINTTAAAAAAPTPTSSQEAAPSSSSPDPPPTTTITNTSAAPPQQTVSPAQPGAAGRIFASPYAKTVAAEKGVDLQLVGGGSGPSGRIVSRDVVQFADSVTTPAAAATTGTVGPPEAAYMDIPLSGMRRTVAARLLQSKQTIPHYYISVDVNMEEVIMLRQQLNDYGKGKFKLSINDFIVKASALAMREVPEANSSWMDTFIRRYNTVDISVAVSTEGGLITPIITNADIKGLKDISIDSKELAEKARAGKLKPHEFQGGTFTISNLGMFGIKSFAAIINPPQSCILAVGKIDKRVVVSSTSADKFEAVHMMSATLSCDHRVLDGAVAAPWLTAFKSLLENPFKMLL